jgi:hypothetical protein
MPVSDGGDEFMGIGDALGTKCQVSTTRRPGGYAGTISIADGPVKYNITKYIRPMGPV